MFSGYRFMWLLVMFDLPVLSKAERKEASEFRMSLLDEGFHMVQFSVYARCCTSPKQIDTYCKRIEGALPAGGEVQILQFTDKQYANIITYYGKKKQPAKKILDQFSLF
ncbi:CRISPR-associated endonuclease Cas2 [Oligella urethralis]|uniref:CRISPR-associated endonuclease Cas2 n=1 Tax=Oligella urethralis TaxID=90245 RepID=UPI002958ADFF|nr:CRISPR-associated endonuclease Cas2 [Oligella urethralis]